MSRLNLASPFSGIGLGALLLSLKPFVIALVRELDDGGLKHRAMSLVYTTLLSLAPLLAVSFSVLKGFGIHHQIEPLLLDLLEPLGDKSAEITANIIRFVENIQVGVLGSVGFVMLFYTVVSVLAQVEDCFNHIWRIDKPRPLYRRFSDYLSIVLIGPVLLFSALGIGASMGNTVIVQKLIALEPFGSLYYLLGIILPYLLIVAAFTFAYAFIPNTSVDLRAALKGGLFAGLTWKAGGLLFTTLVVNSAQYSAIYSGFAAVLIAMIWLNLSWLILLCGGVIAFHAQFPRYLGYTRLRPHLSIRCQEQIGLLLMALIGRQHLGGGDAYSLKHLADRLNLPWEMLFEPLESLTRHGFLIKMADNDSYVLAKDSDAILLCDVLDAVRSAGDQPEIAPLENHQEPAIQQLLAELNKASARLLKDLTLRDVIRDSEQESE